MNIYEKMAGITAELSAVAKNLKVGEGKSSYKAVGEADVLAAVKPLEGKYKVYSYPVSRKIIDSDVLTTTKTYNGQESTSSKFFMRVETVYRFVNAEDPTEHIDVTTYGDGIDSGDKGCGKAMTYADKYALLKAYKIETGDDPDQQASEPLKAVGAKTASPKQIEILLKAYTGDNLTKLLQVNGITKIEDLPQTKASELITKLYSKKGE